MDDASPEKTGADYGTDCRLVNRWSGEISMKRFDPGLDPANSPGPKFSNLMGKQYNKVEKKRRRDSYIKRRKEAAKAAATKPKKKAPVKKKEAAPAEAAGE